MQIAVNIYYGFKWTSDLVTNMKGDFTPGFKTWVADKYNGAEPTDLFLFIEEEGVVDNFIRLRDGTVIYGFYSGGVYGHSQDTGKFTSQDDLTDWKAELSRTLEAWGIGPDKYPDLGVFADFCW